MPLIPTRMRVWFAAIAAALTALLAAYFTGRKDQRHADHERELNEYIETRRRIDAVDSPSDADAARKWLRDRKPDSGM